MTAWRANISTESRGAILLVAGISIFGFSDNLTMLVSDDVGVGQFHLSRSLFAIVMVAILGKLLGLSVIPKLWKPVLVSTLFMVIAIFLYFSVMPMMAIAEAGAGLFTSPIFVLLFSAILFRERIGWRQILAVVRWRWMVSGLTTSEWMVLCLGHLIPCHARENARGC